MKIEEIKVVVDSDTKDFNKDLEQVKKQLNAIDKQIRSVEKAMKAIGGVFKASSGKDLANNTKTAATSLDKAAKSANTLNKSINASAGNLNAANKQAQSLASTLAKVSEVKATVSGGGMATPAVGAGVGAGIASAMAVPNMVAPVATQLAQVQAQFDMTGRQIRASMEGVKENTIQMLASLGPAIKDSINDGISNSMGVLEKFKTRIKNVADVSKITLKEAFDGTLVKSITRVSDSIKKLGSDFASYSRSLALAKKEQDRLDKSMSKVKNTTSALSGKVKLLIGSLLGLAGIRAMWNLATDSMMATDGLQQLARVAGQEGVSAFNAWNQEVSDGITKAQMFGSSLNDTYKTFSRFVNLTGSVQGASDLMDAAIMLQATTGRALEDIEERFRSAFTGSVEAIENVLPITREMLNQQAAIAYGANSYQSLNDAQQKSIMLNMILAQTMTQTGGAITVGQMRVLALRSSLADLRLAWGGVFAVLAEAIIPVFMKLANVVMTVAAYVKAFFELLGFGSSGASDKIQVMNKSIGGSASGLGSAASNAGDLTSNLENAGSAAKKLQRNLMGFDEINTLSQDSGDTGVGSLPSLGDMDFSGIGGGLGDIEALGSAFDDFNKRVADAKEKLQAFWDKWGTLITSITAMITGVLIGTGIMNLINAIGGLTPIIATAFGGFLTLIDDIALGVAGFLNSIPGLAGVAEAALAAPVATVGIVVGIIALAVLTVVDLWRKSEDFRNGWTEVWNNVKDLLMSVWENVIKPICDAIGLALMMIWEGGLKPLWDAWLLVWEQISGIITDFLNFLIPIITSIMDWLGPKITPVLNFLALAFATMVNGVLSIMTGMLTAIGEILGGIRKAFQGILNFISENFCNGWGKAWETVSNIFKGVFDGLVNIAKAPINAVIGMINGMIKGLNKLQIPDWVPAIGGKGINIPEIPRLARGGVVSSGQIYMAGEAGKEAIVPLEHNTQWAKNIGDIVAQQLGGSGPQTNDRPIEVVLQIGSTKMGKVVIDSINKIQQQEGRILLNL